MAGLQPVEQRSPGPVLAHHKCRRRLSPVADQIAAAIGRHFVDHRVTLRATRSMAVLAWRVSGMVPGTISVDCSLHQGNFELTVSNDTEAEVASRFQALIEEITSRDPGELLIERIEANAADENSSGSGLGLLTLMNDYGARLGWDFRSSATGGAVMLSTHAALTLN